LQQSVPAAQVDLEAEFEELIWPRTVDETTCQKHSRRKKLILRNAMMGKWPFEMPL